MRAALVPLALAAALISTLASASDKLNEKISVYSAAGQYSLSYPLAPSAQTSILSQPDGTIQVCVAGVAKCGTFNVPSIVKFPRQIVPGPFVSATRPSWISVGQNNTYLCAISAGRPIAECVQLGDGLIADSDIAVRYRGSVPFLTASSSSKSQGYLSAYVSALKSGLQSAAELLKRQSRFDPGAMPSIDDIYDDSTGEDMPVVEVPGYPDPEPGPGGSGEVPIDWDTGTPGGGGGADADNCGGRATAASSGPYTCPVPSSQLKSCIATSNYMYYEQAIPACKSKYKKDSPEIAVCYAEAANQYAADLQWCHERYPQ